MVDGKIIKFYREKSGISQSELCDEICSKSCLSRYESGKGSLSPESISLLSKRLGIDLNENLELYCRIEKYLNEFNLALIMQKNDQIDEFYKELKKIPFILSTKYAVQYLLNSARYYLTKKMFKKAKKTIDLIEKDAIKLTDYEYNFLLHTKGIYYISIYRTTVSEDMKAAVGVLKQINSDTYKNKEYYYHLALAFHFAGSRLLAYIYAQKALHYFNKTYNYVQAINAQSLLLIQYGCDEGASFEESIQKYNNLICTCDRVGAYIQKGILLNNLGVKHFEIGNYEEASKYFEQSLLKMESSSIYYLRRYFNYVESCLEGKLFENEELLDLINIGLKLARKKQSEIHYTLFNLLKFHCEGNKERYYEFLSEIAVPQFKLIKSTSYYEQYGKKLYLYYIEINQYEKAIKLELQFKSLDKP